MPHAVVVPPLPGKGDHPQGVGQAPGEDEQQKRPALQIHPGQEHQPAPPDEEVQRKVQGRPAAGAEHAHQGHSGQNHGPLDAEQGHAHGPL